MPKRALNPFEAASALIVEAQGSRRDAERTAWKQYAAFRMQDGDEHISTRYWLTVATAIANNEETPVVEGSARPGQKRFDVHGHAVPEPTLGIVSSDQVH